MAEPTEESATGHVSDFGDKDTEHIARFLEHSGAPTMAALVRQRWADQQEMAAAVNGAARPFSFSEEARKALGRALDDSLLSGRSPAEPECSLCVQYAKTGGPSHNPSPFCESGRRPHCSCEVCF